MIIGYICEGCRAVVDEVVCCHVLISDKTAPLITQWRCEECADNFLTQFTEKGFEPHLLQVTQEKKSANVMNLLKSHKISKMGGR